jgi:Dyp-type peroxidase family
MANERPSKDDRDDIQGNLVGFNKDRQRLLFVQFPDGTHGRQFLSALHPEITSATDVLHANAEYKRFVKDEGHDPAEFDTAGVNVALTSGGLAAVGAPGVDTFPPEFTSGMRQRAGLLGDVDASAPANWVPPFNQDSQVHAMVIIAADNAAKREELTNAVTAYAQAAGCTILGAHDGDARPGQNAGHEHFGFKDGISQPSIDGLTRSSKGGNVIAAGEFLIGYEDQDGNISGTPIAPPAPAPGQPGYPPVEPPTPASPMPSWARNGSFVVYRRLRQDAVGFQQFTAAHAADAGVPDGDRLAAKMVGRWPSGAPLAHVPGMPATLDPAAADPSATDPNMLSDEHVNNFGYQERDPDGHFMPRKAHIRASYPRDETPPGHDEADRHRIARRGIAYGPEVEPVEQPYGAGPVTDDRDRGLLFLCYQASIADGFEFIQTQWVNIEAFPQAGDGVDPIISQMRDGAPFTVSPNGHVALQRWVTTTGGDYFFAPSISALAALAAGTSSE